MLIHSTAFEWIPISSRHSSSRKCVCIKLQIRGILVQHWIKSSGSVSADHLQTSEGKKSREVMDTKVISSGVNRSWSTLKVQTSSRLHWLSMTCCSYCDSSAMKVFPVLKWSIFPTSPMYLAFLASTSGLCMLVFLQYEWEIFCVRVTAFSFWSWTQTANSKFFYEDKKISKSQHKTETEAQESNLYSSYFLRNARVTTDRCRQPFTFEISGHVPK